MKLSSELFLSLHNLNAKLMKSMDAHLSMHGISFTEYHILLTLSETSNQTMSRIDLARCVELSASGVTRLLAPMEKLGMVKKEKHPRDARKSLVKLSDSGRRVLADSSVTFNETSASLFVSLTEPQQSKMNQLCARMKR
ncbi:MAG: MarR family transcriptional regulator [Bacteroidetes Order II. Incertae sedis bacterium]|nr:MarR family transcriptional regulator [Bacteroidetes Order II. bacterium]MBT4052017.1 MarR family transcriptional regulator [Bacteroidetes Order II. bacterium]MBT4602041.1 MarR family transcriptional regulator [Bacteroidetes Order II. bacterium]MBT5249835.1 MarR family transcriptional regulator [Bacteroidetes Order II. bacterium]MBT6199254.1 MarR family transcriptional regulator [Bacteroidetes Order II. bacterium]